MGYADSLLADGERITFRSRQHWLAVVLESRWAILMVVGAIVLLWLGSGLDPTGAVGTIRQFLGIVTLLLFLVGLAWIGLTIVNWSNEEYLVTTRRVMKVEGLLNKHSADSSIEKINDAVLDQSAFGRILGYGDLDIMTAAEEEVDRYKLLARAVAFKKEMLNRKHDLEFEQMRPPVSPPLRASADTGSRDSRPVMNMSGESMGSTAPIAAPPPPPPPAAPPAPAARTMTPAEVTQTLSGLADLRDRGAISPEEYEAKKADLLGRL